MSDARKLVNAWIKMRTKKRNLPCFTIEDAIKEKMEFRPRALISLAKFLQELEKK